MMGKAVLDVAETLLAQAGLILFGYGIERLRPARPQGLAALRLNLLYATTVRVLYAALYPASAALTVLIVNHLGGGLITLPDSGPALLIAILVYILTADGLEYAFHRAQHCIPILWAMHSLHHSDPEVNVSTAPRHFWGETPLKAVTIYALLGLVFKANPTVLSAYAVLGLYNYVLHMNVPLGFGRWSFVLNSPQYHRLHHSALPEHHDCNFNQFFPMFDVLFGTYREPKRGEFPPTGLAGGGGPGDTLTMLLWPWRHTAGRNMSNS